MVYEYLILNIYIYTYRYTIYIVKKDIKNMWIYTIIQGIVVVQCNSWYPIAFAVKLYFKGPLENIAFGF